jgi:3-isopropylmalate/(R)-2-methylmalate dehydratase large subunit
MSRLTLFDRLWDSHVIATREDGEALLWVDRHYVHEGSHHAFRKLHERGLPLAEPNLTFGYADHYVPTRGRPVIGDPEVAGMVSFLRENAARHGFRHFDLDDPAQGPACWSCAATATPRRTARSAHTPSASARRRSPTC